ncbi:MAG: DM13 domain-containing protein [Burkholderiaceae bacterium]
MIFGLGGALGASVGAAAMSIALPCLFPPAPANDAVPSPIDTAAATRTTFVFDTNAPGRAGVPGATGSGAVVPTAQGAVLRLEADFEAGPGPNYWIYLNTRPVGEERDFNADSGRVRIAKLKSFKGAQNYALPAGVDPAKFHTVTIWCESFGAYIGSAVLKRS